MLPGGDLHVAAGHRGDAAHMWAADEVPEEGGAEVSAGVEPREDEVWTEHFLRRWNPLLDTRAPGGLVFRILFAELVP